MRSKISGNFNALISDCKASIVDLKEFLSAGKAKTERIDSIKSAMVDDSIEVPIALYSNGSPKEVVKTSVVETILVFADGFQFHPADMDTVYWLVSMAILCDVDLEDFKKISNVLERDKVQDNLLDFIIKYKQTDWQGDSQKIICSHPYQHLSKIIDTSDEEQGISLLQDYLKNKWYQEHDENDAPWVDSHKNTKVNTYFGYWAWETAALVKAKGWDDEKLKDMDYYPYDAVHW